MFHEPWFVKWLLKPAELPAESVARSSIQPPVLAPGDVSGSLLDWIHQRVWALTHRPFLRPCETSEVDWFAHDYDCGRVAAAAV